MALLVFYILLALVVSFICSILEATLLTLTPSSIATSQKKGKTWAVRMNAMKKDIDRPLAAILTLNTLAHTMGAAGAGAQYANLSGNTGEAIFAGILTLAILIFTEIIPKTIGARFALPLAPVTSWLLMLMVKVLALPIWCLQRITALIGSQGGGHGDQTLQREELLTMAQMGEESGSIDKNESRFFYNLMHLRTMQVSDIMTPRPVIYSLDEKTTLEDFVKPAAEVPFTRIPVYGKNPDDITGFVLRGEVLMALVHNDGKAKTLADVKRPVELTQEFIHLDTLFNRFTSEKQHLMLVADEFGTNVGLVTLEDLIETIFGIEIVDERDKVEDMQELARKLWSDRAKKMGITLPEVESETKRDRQPEPSESDQQKS